jgi:hypothetical protein
VTLSEETERNREYKLQPLATAPVFYSTYLINFWEFELCFSNVRTNIDGGNAYACNNSQKKYTELSG